MSARRIATLLALMAAAPAGAEDEPMGLLQVNSNVEGSTVYVDYEEAGAAPLMQYLPPGSYSVRVSADDHLPFVRKIDIVADSTTKVDAQLYAGAGSVEFVITPPGAQIEIDGRPVGTAPIRLSDVAPGEHQYRITASRYEEMTGSFTFDTGQNLLLVHKLEDATGRFSFQSEPEGATIFLDGEEVGVTPMQMEGVAPGVHRVRLEMEGHATVLRSVDTTDGGKGEVTARLSDSYARQVFKGGTGDTTWSVEGQVLGQGSNLKTQLDRGTYLLKVEDPERQTLETTLIVDREGKELWEVSLVEATASGSSHLEEGTPLFKNWIFWTALGAGAAGAGVTTAVLLQPEEPAPLPSGDLAVTLP